MTSVEQASVQSLPQTRRRWRLIAGTGLAALVPTALFGWALNEYLYELKWLVSSSGWLDGEPDQLVVVAGTAGLVLLAGVAFGAYRLARRTSSGQPSPRQALACALTGVGIPLVLLALVLLVWAAASPLTSVLVPVP
ncbi:hypothetical protein [Oerskovia enterophila]|uniref:hypothetical protein n=1 Tax=Oerskovia enterophila TaxID=43678 RepID=UPI00382D8BB2